MCRCLLLFLLRVIVLKNNNNAGVLWTPASLYVFCRNEFGLLFLATVTVAAHELVYAACGVDEFLLAGEEGVA